jgi:hypothetical protein
LKEQPKRGQAISHVAVFIPKEHALKTILSEDVREALAKTMMLRPDQHITLGQSVGYPKN